MSDEQINAAIAEACGFVGWDEVQLKKSGPKFRFWDYPKNWDGPNRQPWVPDFCRDLNAMHEAEKTLKGYDQIHTYVWHLENRDDWHTDLKLMVAHATARQRAEAFLRTLGKWEDSK
jgi:hypothetical protein